MTILLEKVSLNSGKTEEEQEETITEENRDIKEKDKSPSANTMPKSSPICAFVHKFNAYLMFQRDFEKYDGDLDALDEALQEDQHYKQHIDDFFTRQSGVSYDENIKMIATDPNNEKLLDEFIRYVSIDMGYANSVASLSNMVQEAKKDPGVETAVDLLLEVFNQEFIDAIDERVIDIAPLAA